MKTRVALLVVALSLAPGCGSSGSSASTSAAPEGSHDHGGGDTAEHPHEDGSGGATDGHAHEDPGSESSDGTEPSRDACAEIAELCHDVDDSSADAHDCHVIGHSHGGGAGCDEHLEHCRAACTAAPGSGHGDHAH